LFNIAHLYISIDSSALQLFNFEQKLSTFCPLVHNLCNFDAQICTPFWGQVVDNSEFRLGFGVDNFPAKLGTPSALKLASGKPMQTRKPRPEQKIAKITNGLVKLAIF
jgi:hypothetical protein